MELVERMEDMSVLMNYGERMRVFQVDYQEKTYLMRRNSMNLIDHNIASERAGLLFLIRKLLLLTIDGRLLKVHLGCLR